MFTCPEKDIHSIYLDGELPAKFAKDYESHIATCEKCQSKLKKLQVMHKILSDDAASINLNKKFLDESYSRLQSRMRFTNIVRMSVPQKSASIKRTFIPMAAAAAAVFAIMLPLKMNSAQNMAPSAEAMPIVSKTESLTPIAKSDVFVEGGLKDVVFHSESVNENPEQKSEQKTLNKNSAQIAKTSNSKLELKVSNFNLAKQEEAEKEESGMTIRLTELTNMNSTSAANVSFDQFNAPDFLK